MQLSQRATLSIIHDQKGHAVLHIVVEDADDRGVDKCRDDLRFLLKVFSLGLGEVRVQYLDGGLLVEPQVLAQVHLGKAALS